MLGVCLLFVGIVLINNGVCALANVDKKSAAVMNILTGGLSLFINFVNLVQGNYYAAGTGLDPKARYPTYSEEPSLSSGFPWAYFLTLNHMVHILQS